ncbi:MAG: AAA family ATPase, partial [Cyanobacteria bacterium P01_D01_bin.73]
VPVMVAAIAQKLMAKTAEDRYQSALGLKHDLERCLEQWRETGAVAEFELGERDLSDRFLIPEKLYGREGEVQTLLDAFDRASRGSSELTLVAGFSGIGKTAVINEVHKPIVARRGYFIRGKFDQFKRNIPFSAFVQAFRDLMEQLSSESDAELQDWKSQLLDALGDDAQIIVELIPELERIIGPQPPVSELLGTAAQNRFNLLFQRFIQVFTTAKHPLVIFLDDLQWADSASLNLIHLLMGESQPGHLLLLGAYRDNEVGAGHPLLLTLDEMGEARANIETITLRPLNSDSVTQLVSDTLRAPASTVQTLAELVIEQTQGNPFFATQLLQNLHQEQCIVFDYEAGYWHFDQLQIQDASLGKDVLKFMAARLKKLPAATQKALKLSACLGARFDLQTLATVLEEESINVAAALWPVLQSGFIVPKDELYKLYVGEDPSAQQRSQTEILHYRFLHDRVQQAAYSLIPEAERGAVHLNIGRILRQTAADADLEERSFELVNHFNQGAELLQDQEERTAVANLNIIAARKARSSTAYGAMVGYTQSGIDLLAPDVWTTDYELAFTLHCLAIKASYLAGALDEMQELLDLTLVQARDDLDTAKVNEWAIAAHIARQQFAAGFECSVQTLKLLGIDFPMNVDSSTSQELLKETRQLIPAEDIMTLAALPVMTDERSLLAMRILNVMIAPTYQSHSYLLPTLYALAVRLSIQQGNSLDSAVFYASYGGLLCATEEKPDDGCACGDLALALLEKSPDKSRRSRTYLLTAVSASSWKSHINSAIQIMQMGIDSAEETGDLENKTWNCFNQNQLCYFAGRNLADFATKLERDVEAIALTEQPVQREYIAIIHQAVLNLITPESELGVLTGTALDESNVLEVYQAQGIEQGLFCIYLHKAILYFLDDEIELAFPQIERAGQHLGPVLGHYVVPIFHFYRGLICAALECIQETTLDYDSEMVRENLRQSKEFLKHCAEGTETNFLHKFQLLVAEERRLLGTDLEMLDLYDAAIAGAKENGFIQEEALGNELAAKFYLCWGKEKVAAEYMQEAYYCYARWGADAKVVDLEATYPALLQ